MPSTTSSTVAVPRRLKPVVAALVAGAGFLAAGAVSVVHPVGDEHWGTAAYLLNLAFLVGLGGAAVAILSVGGLLALGRAGRGGVIAVEAGFALMAVQTLASLVKGHDVIGGAFFLGVLVVLVGGVVIAVSGLRAGVQRAAAVALPVSWVLALGLGDHGGTALFGLLWLFYAFALGRRTGASASQPVETEPVRG